MANILSCVQSTECADKFSTIKRFIAAAAWTQTPSDDVGGVGASASPSASAAASSASSSSCSSGSGAVIDEEAAGGSTLGITLYDRYLHYCFVLILCGCA